MSDTPEKTDAPADAPAQEKAAESAPDPLEAAKADVAKLREQLLRTAADFDNYRKRSRKEVDDAHKKGSEELLRALLPVFDNLERAVVHAESTTDAKAIAEGVKMVLKQFQDSLGRLGIKRIGGVGCRSIRSSTRQSSRSRPTSTRPAPSSPRSLPATATAIASCAPRWSWSRGRPRRASRPKE